MDFDNLTPELKKKALACKTPEELFELAKSEGMELTQEQLDSISGAGDTIWYSCDDKACPTYCARKDMPSYC